MTNFFSSHKMYLLIAAGLFVAIGIWWGFSSEAPSDSLLTTSPTGVSAADKELVDTLLQLRTVSLTGTILAEPAFMQLQDFGTQIVPEPVGRPNPFAPLDVSATTSSVGIQLFKPQR